MQQDKLSPLKNSSSRGAWFLKRALWWIVLTIIGCLLMLTFLQSKLLYFPDKHIISSPAQVLLPYKDIYFRSKNGKKLNAWWIHNSEAKYTILFAHGNAGNISHRLMIAQQLYALPANILMFDYQGYGKSEGSPSEQGTYEDIQAAWDTLTSTFKKKPEEIIIMGKSLGGPIAAHLASQVKHAGLILDSTFSSFVDAASAHFPFLPVKLIARFDYTTLTYTLKRKGLYNGKPSPLLLLHSPKDEVIPFKLGQKIYEKTSEPKTFIELSKGGHNDSFYHSKKAYTQAIKKLFAELQAKAMSQTIQEATTKPTSKPTTKPAK